MGKVTGTSLTDKQERFCREYVVDLNGTQAAIRAGYAKGSADVQSSRLLGDAKVLARIKELKGKTLQKLEITAELILNELLALATVDLSEAYNEDGGLKNIHDIPLNVRKAMASIDVFEEFDGFGREREKIGETRKVKFYDKTRALELLGKHLKLFTDQVDHKHRVTLGELIDESMEEEKE